MSAGVTAPRDVTLIVSGMFLWDYSSTLWFELEFVKGEHRLRWPLIPYFLARYTTLGFVIGSLIFVLSTERLNCDSLYISGNFLSKAAVTSASVNLIVRTVIIWAYRWYIVIPLGALVVVEIILIGIGLRHRGFFAVWSDEFQRCVGTNGTEKNDAGLFAPFALSVDCIIIILTVVGLRKFNPNSGFAAVLIRQGLSFFILVLLFQTLVIVAAFSEDSWILVSTASILCAVIVPTISCYLVRSVLTGSRSTSGQSPTLCAGSTTAGRNYPDGIQLTTNVEVGSCSTY